MSYGQVGLLVTVVFGLTAAAFAKAAWDAKRWSALETICMLGLWMYFAGFIASLCQLIDVLAAVKGNCP